MRHQALIGALLALAVAAAPSSQAAAMSSSELWAALRAGGHVALMRHASAPGTGDPRDFRIGDCTTQRNLSDEGRNQASRIGERFRQNGIDRARVFSSQWCRCLETARLLGIGPVRELQALNSFFRDRTRRDGQTEALEAWMAGQNLESPVVLVTHQVNITALTGIYPVSGEIVVVAPRRGGGVAVLGTIKPD